MKWKYWLKFHEWVISSVLPLLLMWIHHGGHATDIKIHEGRSLHKDLDYSFAWFTKFTSSPSMRWLYKTNCDGWKQVPIWLLYMFKVCWTGGVINWQKVLITLTVLRAKLSRQIKTFTLHASVLSTHKHTHIHSCTSIFVRTLIGIMHSLDTYPNLHLNLIIILKTHLKPKKFHWKWVRKWVPAKMSSLSQIVFTP